MLKEQSAERLLAIAKQAMERAYVPYSNFRVGAALVGTDNQVYVGCNVENAAYGPTNCAERTAIFSAIAVGAQPLQFKSIAVIGDTETPITPCGVCRQVLVELCPPDMPVIMGNIRGDVHVMTVSELLPGAFTPVSLQKGEQ